MASYTDKMLKKDLVTALLARDAEIAKLRQALKASSKPARFVNQAPAGVDLSKAAARYCEQFGVRSVGKNELLAHLAAGKL